MNFATDGSGRLIFRGSGGSSSGRYYVLTSTNIALPPSEWTPVATNSYDTNGDFSFTNQTGVDSAQRFYRLQLPRGSLVNFR